MEQFTFQISGSYGNFQVKIDGTIESRHIYKRDIVKHDYDNILRFNTAEWLKHYKRTFPQDIDILDFGCWITSPDGEQYEEPNHEWRKDVAVMRGENTDMPLKLSNYYATFSFNPATKEILGSDTTDLNNLPTCYNQTSRSALKAWKALVAAWDGETKMYPAARILAPFVRMHTYCAMD